MTFAPEPITGRPTPVVPVDGAPLPASHARHPAALGDDAGGGAPFPLTPNQLAIWTHEALFPNTPAYTIGGCFRLAPGVDAARIIAVLQRVVESHEALRLRFRETPDGPRQYVAPLDGYAQENGPGDDSAFGIMPRQDGNDWDRLIGFELCRPFDLLDKPLFRFNVLEREPSAGHLLLIILHHLIGDFSSIDLIVRDLEQSNLGLSPGEATPFSRAALGQAPEPPAKQPSLGQSWRQAGHLNTHAAARDNQYWTRQLGPLVQAGAAKAARLPRPAAPRFVGFEVRRRLSPALTARVRALAGRFAVTPYILTMAAFLLIEGWETGRRRQIITTTMDLRDRPDLRNTMGYLVNILPLGVEWEDELSFHALCVLVQDAFRRALPHRKLPFAQLVRDLRLVRDAGAQPLSQVLFTWLKFDAGFGHDHVGKMFVDTYVPARNLRAGITHDVVLTVEDRLDTYECCWRFDEDLFQPAKAQEVAGRYQRLLETLDDSGNALLGDLFQTLCRGEAANESFEL
ncbi:condensation domain-containing protein [Nitrospirillum amazonense]|uniref:Condensation domain-containing protein n=1 Tax=Nitrospirillum amazonense TaxID=28077 RepID=A0A560ET07_9PROT|nr:condensation domain-containing protein [Nitrospirillum amazonense]